MTRYQPNPRFRTELLRSEQIVPVIKAKTDEVRDKAAEFARERSNTIADSIDSDVGMTAEGWRGRVNAWDFKSGWAEFGTSRFPQVRMLGRALEAVLGRVEGDR